MAAHARARRFDRNPVAADRAGATLGLRRPDVPPASPAALLASRPDRFASRDLTGKRPAPRTDALLHRAGPGFRHFLPGDPPDVCGRPISGGAGRRPAPARPSRWLGRRRSPAGDSDRAPVGNPRLRRYDPRALRTPCRVGNPPLAAGPTTALVAPFCSDGWDRPRHEGHGVVLSSGILPLAFPTCPQAGVAPGGGHGPGVRPSCVSRRLAAVPLSPDRAG